MKTMNDRLRPVALTSLAAIAMLSTRLNAAQLSYGGYTRTNSGGCASQVYDSSVAYSCQSSADGGAASIYAQSTFGSLHTAAGASAADSSLPYGAGGAVISASFEDTLVFSRAPASGYVDISITAEGHSSAICTIAGNCSANTALQGNGNGGTMSSFRIEALPSGSNIYDLVIPFNYSSATDYAGRASVVFSFLMTSQATCAVQESCEAISDFSNTAFISAVGLYDSANGRISSAFTSESGAMYPAATGATGGSGGPTTSAPEIDAGTIVASMTLLLSSLALIRGRRR